MQEAEQNWQPRGDTAVAATAVPLSHCAAVLCLRMNLPACVCSCECLCVCLCVSLSGPVCSCMCLCVPVYACVCVCCYASHIVGITVPKHLISIFCAMYANCVRPSVYVCVCMCVSIKAAGQLLTVFVNCFLLLLYSIFYFLKISRTQIKR